MALRPRLTTGLPLSGRNLRLIQYNFFTFPGLCQVILRMSFGRGTDPRRLSYDAVKNVFNLVNSLRRGVSG